LNGSHDVYEGVLSGHFIFTPPTLGEYKIKLRGNKRCVLFDGHMHASLKIDSMSQCQFRQKVNTCTQTYHRSFLYLNEHTIIHRQDLNNIYKIITYIKYFNHCTTGRHQETELTHYAEREGERAEREEEREIDRVREAEMERDREREKSSHPSLPFHPLYGMNDLLSTATRRALHMDRNTLIRTATAT